MTVTLFHHPGAGEGEWSGERMIAALREAGFDPAMCEMDDEDWEAALAATDELAIVAGGDGSIAAVASRLAGRDVPLAILPTGSGNNIARSVGVLWSPDIIIARLKQAKHGPLRIAGAVGSFGTHIFLESIGLGAIACSVQELQHERLDGSDKLLRGRDSLFSAVQVQDDLPATILVDGEALGARFLVVEVMNLSMIGPNLRLVPDTALAGDNLSVALLLADERDTMLSWLAAGGVGVAPLRHVQGRHVALEGSAQPLRLGDKTIDWDGSRVDIRVEPHRLDLLRPGDHR